MSGNGTISSQVCAACNSFPTRSPRGVGRTTPVAHRNFDVRQWHDFVPGVCSLQFLPDQVAARRRDDDGMPAGRAEELATSQAGGAFHVLPTVNAVEFQETVEWIDSIPLLSR